MDTEWINNGDVADLIGQEVLNIVFSFVFNFLNEGVLNRIDGLCTFKCNIGWLSFCGSVHGLDS